MSHDRRYSTTRWRKLRTAVRARDGNRCMLKLPGCTHVAQHVDHIFEPGPPELQRDDLFYAVENCRSSCRACNISKRNTRTAGLARQALGLTPTTNSTNPPDDNEHRHYRWSRQWWDCRCHGCQRRRTERPETAR